MKNFLRAVASTLLLTVAIVASADWTTVQRDFLNAKTHDEAVHKVEQSEAQQDETLGELLEDYNSASTKVVKEQTYDSIKQYLAANALSESFKPAVGSEAKVKAIKKDAIYSTQREVTSSNWIQKLLNRLKNFFDRDSTSNNGPTGPPPGWIFPLLQAIFYLVTAVVIGLLIYLLTKIPWGWTKAGRAKKQKRGGMLEEGENLLSEDEYLLDADRLIAEGKYREACRALYLASLLRIDKSRIARFEPAQTNWEHLRRIETSPLRPENLHFRPVTKQFDLAWYGYRAKYLDDVLIFRETYLVIKSLTETMV